MPTRIGVDTGGTFTDLVAIDEQSGEIQLIKTPSTPDDPGRAILEGIQQGVGKGLWRCGDISMLVHGTTVATNALLERRGAKTALVTTAGFRDVLEIQRQDRPRMYDLRSRRPEPLVPRHLRLELSERILADGTIGSPLDEAQLEEICFLLSQAQIESVVVGLLHSHVNPKHELRVGEILSERLPDIAICLSHQIASQQGEFERFSTAAASGYVQPVVQKYLSRLQRSLGKIGVAAPVYVMKSSGGASLAESMAQQCIQTALSGPAGGVRAVSELAARIPSGNLIAADMGGTSFDVAVVTAGKPQLAREAKVGGLPLRIPMLDIHTIGAGGGSIGWVDPGGALRVGPESAGARPGPACYGHGGERPTVTDANLVLGRLSAASPLASGMKLHAGAAHEAIQQHLASPLGMTVHQAALGMIKVVNASMVAALRELTVERGIDPQDYAICPFGGAGPLHGVELAEELGIAKVIVPHAPGVFSAWGLLQSNLREDRSASMNAPLEQSQRELLKQTFQRLETEAADELAAARSAGKFEIAGRTVLLRYKGQSSDLPIDCLGTTQPEIDKLATAFHSAHKSRYGFDRPDHPIEIVGLSVTAEVKLPKFKTHGTAANATATSSRTERNVWFSEEPVQAAVYERRSLVTSQSIEGPAVTEQEDTVTLIPPGWCAAPHEDGALLISVSTSKDTGIPKN